MQGKGLQVSKAKDVTMKNPIVLSREMKENVCTFYFFFQYSCQQGEPKGEYNVTSSKIKMANPGTEMVFEALSCHETALRGNPAVSGFTTLHR